MRKIAVIIAPVMASKFLSIKEYFITGGSKMSKKVTKTQMVMAKELAEMLGVSERHVWRMRAQGKLPRPMNIGNCVRWYLKDIELWLELGCPEMAEFANVKLHRRKNASA